MRLERSDQAYVLCRRGAGKRAEGFQGTQDPSIYEQGRRLCEGGRPRALGSREHAVHPCGNTRSAKKAVPNGRTPGSIEIGHNEGQDMPSIKAAYDKIEADGATVEEDLGLKRYRMFQAIAYGETAISVELDLYAKLSAMVDRPLVG